VINNTFGQPTSTCIKTFKDINFDILNKSHQKHPRSRRCIIHTLAQ